MNEVREKILYTAFSMFVNDGYKAVSISELVKRCGCTKGAIYHYFENKEQIFNEILENFFCPVLASLCGQIEALEGSALQRFDAFFSLYEAACTEVSDYPDFPELEYGIYYLLIEGSKYNPDFRVAVAALYASLFRAAEGIIRLGCDEGVFSLNLDAAAAGRMLVSLTEGAYLLWIVNKSESLEKVFASAKSFARAALRAG